MSVKAGGREARKGGRHGNVDLLSGGRLQDGRSLLCLRLFSMLSEEEGRGDEEDAAEGAAP